MYIVQKPLIQHDNCVNRFASRSLTNRGNRYLLSYRIIQLFNKYFKSAKYSFKLKFKKMSSSLWLGV